MFRSHVAVVLGLSLSLAVAGCGGKDSPTKPEPGCFAVVGNKGNVTATIQGLAAFTGVVPTGGATSIAGAASFVTVTSTNVSDGTTVLIQAPAVVGSSALGLSSINTAAGVAVLSVQTRSCTAGTGLWMANVASPANTATITITAISGTSVTGTFSGTLPAVAGSGGSGTKTINGQFSATF